MRVPYQSKPKLRVSREEARERLAELLAAAEKDESILLELTRNPFGVISEEIGDIDVSRQQVSEGNRLTYALISNEEMLEWLTELDIEEGSSGKEKFISDFSQKIMEIGDPIITSAILSNAAVGNGLPGIGPVAHQCIVSDVKSKNSAVCTPVAKSAKDANNSPIPGISPATMRSISEALIDQARQLRESGKLSSLDRLV